MRSNLAEVPQLEDSTFQELESRPHLYLVADPINQDSTETNLGRFVNAESIPELSIERQRAAQEATRILAQNRHLLHSGYAENVPEPIEVLGTARQVVGIKREKGIDSPEFEELYKGLLLDSERLIGEASSRNISEYFGLKAQTLQPATREYFSHGLSISNMTRNGLSPTAQPEEQPRRINEHVEENGTYVPIGMMIAEKGLRRVVEHLRLPVERDIPELSVEVTTISECTDSAIESYKVNPKGAHGGYRPAIEGVVIRRVHYAEDKDDSGDREEEQAIISGLYITHDIIEKVVTQKGGIEQDQKLTKTEMQGSQFISVNNGSLMEFVRQLDEEASKVHDINIFMGEEVADDHPKDYYEFIEQAEERRKRLAPLPTQLTEFLITLEEEGIDSQTAEALTNQFLKDSLLTRAKNHPELAEAMFDSSTAEGFEKVARLNALGRVNEAQLLELEVRQNAPEPSYCGANDSKDAKTEDAVLSSGEVDKYGSLKFKCPNGHINTRPRDKLIDSCQVCGTSVKC